ncbi:GGDEF domain-containing protein [Noviherbaspirillum humi]|nr:GGDEF domain-containing protein [Noviherbaspirillum humi]
MHAENILFGCVMAGSIAPVFGLLYLYLGDPATAWLCFAAIPPILAVPLLLGRGIALARDALIAVIFLLLLGICYRVGGISSPSIIWFSMCSFIAMLGGGLRAALRWAILSVLAVLGIYAAQKSGFPFPAVQVRDMPLLQLVSTIGIICSVGLDIFLFEKSRTNLVRELNQAMHAVQHLATHDELTGVFNRREILRLAEQEKHRAERHGGDFCICLIDIDHFKAINDSFGHGIGDQVIREIACAMQSEVRKTDHVGRYGGEEFLMLLTSTSADAAQAFAERIRQRVAAARLPLLEAKPVTISMGIAAFRPDETVAQAIARADEALYRAKWEGRNRIEMALGMRERSAA